jgi:hypothetical protein
MERQQATIDGDDEKLLQETSHNIFSNQTYKLTCGISQNKSVIQIIRKKPPLGRKAFVAKVAWGGDGTGKLGPFLLRLSFKEQPSRSFFQARTVKEKRQEKKGNKIILCPEQRSKESQQDRCATPGEQLMAQSKEQRVGNTYLAWT